MRRTLDNSLQRVLGSLEGLRAVVLSVAPDGLIAWCWSREDKPEIALGFAALDRAATICLEGLGASQNARNLLLTTQDAWVASWPLYDVEDFSPGRERLVLTTVFDGKLRNGMIMVYGMRVRAQIRTAMNTARAQACMQLRAQLVDFMLAAPDPGAALRDLATTTKLELDQLEHIDQLSEDERQRVAEVVAPRLALSSTNGLSVVTAREL